MKHFVFAFSLFSSVLFFSFTAILGISYLGSAESNLLRYYCIFAFAVSLLVFFVNYLPQKKQRNNIIVFFIAFVYLLSGFIAGLWSDKSFLCFGAFSIPAICIGVYYGNRGSFSEIVKWFDVILWVLTISLAYSSMTLSRSMASGDSYYSQSLSYNAAMAFVLDLYLLSYGKDYKRFSIFESKLFRLLGLILLLVYPVIILYSGGRGGGVVVFVGLVVYLLISRKNKRKTNLFLGGFLLLLGFGLSTMIYDFGTNSFLSDIQRNSERVFSYITSEGIDMTQTSSRDYVYSRSLEYIGQHPLGAGLFSYKKTFQPFVGQSYPHNFLLEWMVQGGLIFSLIWSFALFFLLRKYHRLRHQGLLSPLLIPFFVYSLTLLMFSASYMEEPLFWFSFSFVFVFNPSRPISDNNHPFLS